MMVIPQKAELKNVFCMIGKFYFRLDKGISKRLQYYPMIFFIFSTIANTAG